MKTESFFIDEKDSNSLLLQLEIGEKILVRRCDIGEMIISPAYILRKDTHTYEVEKFMRELPNVRYVDSEMCVKGKHSL